MPKEYNRADWLVCPVQLTSDLSRVRSRLIRLQNVPAQILILDNFRELPLGQA
jgi:hypothetical protein